jgi:biopolymer transport protein ExbD
MRRARRPKPQAEMITKVNVTPIIDVALVLVIILLVTAPIISSTALRVQLPEAHTRAPDDEHSVSVVIEPEGDFRIEEDAIPPARLVEELRARLARAGGGDERVVIWADMSVPYSKVETVLEAARTAGARRLAIATRQKQGVRE